MNLQKARIHFVGIGGIGMSGIAEVLVNMGCTVTGSDPAENSQVERLRSLGVVISQSHGAKNVPQECHAVVFSSAVDPKNPELQEARKRKIPVIQRAEMLAELMRLRRGIAIGGTHGKTSTTSMTATVLTHAKLDPTIVVGGRLDLIKSSAALGKGEWFLAEADESDQSFLKLSPEIVVMTNIDNDHLENYKNFDDLKAAFINFAGKVPFYGCAILCVEDPLIRSIAKKILKRTVTYGFRKDADLRAENLRVKPGQQIYDVTWKRKILGAIELNIPGRHSVLNSLASIGVALELGVDFATIKEGLKRYNGVDRRLQKIGEIRRIQVYDDYGHHPTEVKATLSALKELYPQNRKIVVFQPHRYSRTKTCWKQFMTCFQGADMVGFLDIYSAGEKKIKGIDSRKLVRALTEKNRKGQIYYWGNQTKALKELKKILREGDVLLTLGAGNIFKLGREFLKLWD